MSGIIKIWNEFYSVFAGSQRVNNNVLANAYVEGNTLKIEIAAPGHKLEDFIIAYNEKYKQLSVRAKQSVVRRTSRIWLRHEFELGAFTRIFQLERVLDKDGMQKKYDSGVLYLDFPVIEPSESVA